MALQTTSPLLLFFTLLFFLFLASVADFNIGHPKPECEAHPPLQLPVHPYDVDLLHFALNLEYTEAEWFLFGALGYGLDELAPEMAKGGPPPIGAQKARLDNTTRHIITEFGYQEIGHLRAIKSTVGGFPRPLIDLSAHNFARIFDRAFGYNLSPPFNPYTNNLNFLLASYVIPYMGLVGYVGANQNIMGFITKKLSVGLLGVEAGQDAVIRALLYEHAEKNVPPYNITVAEFTDRISDRRNQLGMCGVRDEGLSVAMELGTEQRVTSNILSADEDSLSYGRTPEQILRVVYGTGSERAPGGIWPNGANGVIARDFLV